ncbi:hypothetical protein SAMD00019534_082110, partial [Acytostelium subglobosum LB1]|uniref:hypothetical protein n=1 Tax=Acytostelium subglobosum LB1 TaxID=1410327 RepID=UPI0006449DE4
NSYIGSTTSMDQEEAAIYGCSGSNDPSGHCFSHEQREVLHYVLVAGSCLTLIGTGFILLTFLFKHYKSDAEGRQQQNEDGAKMIFFITLPGFLGAFFWFPWESKSHSIYCIIQATGIQFFEISSQVWSACIVVVFLKVLSMLCVSAGDKMAWFHLISWGVPLASVLPFLALKLFGPTPGPWCWIMSPGLRLIVYGLGCIIVIFNVTIYVYLRYKLRHNEEYSVITRRFFGFILASVICQLPSLVNRIQNYLDPTNPIFALYLMQTILQPTQGFVNALIYGIVDEYFWSSFYDQFCCLCIKKKTDDLVGINHSSPEQDRLIIDYEYGESHQYN